MTRPWPGGYAEFVTLFNSQKFFEAHEALEAEWHREKRRNDFYKGLIQLAAALVHVQKQNLSGARQLVANAKKYLAPFFPCRDGIDLEKLFKEIDEVINESSRRMEREPKYPLIMLGN